MTTAIYHFDTGRWSLGPPLHHAREHAAAVATGGAIWLLGGRALGQGNFADVERLRPGARSWQRMPPMPIARSSFQAVDAAGGSWSSEARATAPRSVRSMPSTWRPIAGRGSPICHSRAPASGRPDDVENGRGAPRLAICDAARVLAEHDHHGETEMLGATGRQASSDACKPCPGCTR